MIASPRATGHTAARSGQFAIRVRATATARRRSRMSSPICSAAPSEPPCEEMRTGSRRPQRSRIALRNAPAVPGRIIPSAEIHSGQLGSHAGSELMTRTMRIGGSPRGRGGSFKSASAPEPAARKPASAMAAEAAAVHEASSRRRVGGRDLVMKADLPDPGRIVQTAARALFCQSPGHAAHGNAGDFARGVDATKASNATLIAMRTMRSGPPPRQRDDFGRRRSP